MPEVNDIVLILCAWVWPAITVWCLTGLDAEVAEDPSVAPARALIAGFWFMIPVVVLLMVLGRWWARRTFWWMG